MKLKIRIGVFLKYSVMLFFLLLGLTSCNTRGAFFDFIQLDYSNSLSKSKATTSGNTCTFFHRDGQTTSSINKRNNQNNSIDALTTEFFVVRESISLKKYTKKHSGNSPPKYILYKRLRLAIA